MARAARHRKHWDDPSWFPYFKETQDIPGFDSFDGRAFRAYMRRSREEYWRLSAIHNTEKIGDKLALITKCTDADQIVEFVTTHARELVINAQVMCTVMASAPWADRIKEDDFRINGLTLKLKTSDAVAAQFSAPKGKPGYDSETFERCEYPGWTGWMDHEGLEGVEGWRGNLDLARLFGACSIPIHVNREVDPTKGYQVVMYHEEWPQMRIWEMMHWN